MVSVVYPLQLAEMDLASMQGTSIQVSITGVLKPGKVMYCEVMAWPKAAWHDTHCTATWRSGQCTATLKFVRHVDDSLTGDWRVLALPKRARYTNASSHMHAT